MTLQTWLAQHPAGLVLDPYQGIRLQSLDPLSFKANTQALLIGPEGGLSPSEVTQSIETGMIPVQLGPRILRTETAGPAAIAALQSLFGDA
jgi:16S rRNA (uracil1498-N3)-methyltransferase